ncbi:glucosylceramide transporter ABCA12-like [Mixophyes fleayi]|uniref:glucosylceramide transporter ABCA12-like n=1 Tax=Mixophyes fleayi TaxID=3061075 RepID=UPI003F4DCC61
MAVKDLSLNFYENQITALLGPNGAGKTTILSMLNSQLLPTLGKIFVNGRDMQTELSTIRTEMGVCPQYDVLFENLTIEEHLLLFGALKMPTCPKKQLYQEVKQAIKDVDLFQHRLKYTCSLSGGMKRRLSIAIALIGNAKTIVLDEPTSGVDPCSRRSIWDILLKHRQGRTIIFTTHNLDEAEFLSDRIAIIQNGTLTCCGSPSSLKQKYGHGHELTLIKTNDLTNITQVTSLVQEYFPSAFLNKNTHTGLVFVIPGEVDAAMYKHLFQRLDNNLHPLHISGYGITGATMEKVGS